MSSHKDPAGRDLLTEDQVRDMIARWLDPARVPKHPRILFDTSDFFRVDYDDVLVLGSVPYLIRNYEREGRFGIDEEPKFWVRRAMDLTDGKMKIIKFVFREEFKARIGDVVYDCVRSPRKEARILEMVKGHPNFMQGFSVQDSSGNIVRVADYIPGKTLADYALGLGEDHEDYYYTHLPAVLEEYVETVTAIKFLHDHGEKHGDIRRDHVIKDRATGRCVWIDFDYNYYHKEHMFGYDLYGLGNIFIYLVGRGDVTVQSLRRQGSAVMEKLDDGDLNVIFRNRVVNLKKVYPYITDSLNFILMHFSSSAEVFYEDTEELLTDLKEAKSW
ncbi:MAG: hypothetical protein P8013_14520 [Candidatus Sulfobium sp.]|jgi:hypothetical protein